MGIAIDYATGRPGPSALIAAGATGVIRYLSWLYQWGGTTHTYANPKIIQQPEFDALHTAGLDITLNWEYDAQDWLSGASGGSAHATEAVRQARALGYPAGRVILGSADFNMTSAQWSASGSAYARAFATTVAAAGYTPGVYGPYDVLTWCKSQGLMRVFWQAGMASSWSGGRNANLWPGANLRQRRVITIGGVSCDASDILTADYGQYLGGSMSLTSADAPVIQQAVKDTTVSTTPPAGMGGPTDAIRFADYIGWSAGMISGMSAAISALAKAVAANASIDQDIKAELDQATAQLAKLAAAPGLSGPVQVSGTLTVAPPAP